MPFTDNLHYDQREDFYNATHSKRYDKNLKQSDPVLNKLGFEQPKDTTNDRLDNLEKKMDKIILLLEKHELRYKTNITPGLNKKDKMGLINLIK